MLLRYIEFKNFLSHRRERISCPSEGMFLLAGDSGSGKSSLIVDGVAYALFGPAATRARRQTDLIHASAAEDEGMWVKAMFDFEENERLVVERGFNGQSYAKIYAPPANGNESTLLAEGAKPVSRFISKRLGGMNWQQFYAAFVARQSEISNLTTLKGAERKNLIQRMLGMRELEKASELVTDRLRRANAEVDQLQRQVGGDVDLQEARARLAEARKRDHQERGRLEESRLRLKQEEEGMRAVENELADLQGAVEASGAVESKAAEEQVARAKKERLKEACLRHERAQELVQREPGFRESYDAAVKQRDDLRDSYNRSRAYATKSEELAAAQERRSELRAKVKSPELVVAGGMPDDESLSAEQARARIEVSKATVSRADEDIGERSEQLERLRQSGQCYVCQRPFQSDHDHDDVMKDLTERLDLVKSQRQEAQSEMAELSAVLPILEEIESVEATIESVRARMSEIAEEGAISDDIEVLVENGKEAADRVETVGAELAKVSAARQDLSPDAASELETVAEELERATKALQEAKENAADRESLERHSELTKRHSELQESVASLRAQVPERERAKDASERELAGLERDLEGREADVKNLERLRERAMIVEAVGSHISAYQRQLANEIRPALTEIGSEMLNQISNGRHVAMHIDDDYEISVETSDGAIQKAAMLSGGEEIRANICLRLALTRLVSQRTGVPVGFLVFDEPLPSQDPGHIERILELMDSLRPFYQQQFIISHVGDLRSSDEVNYILEFTSSDEEDRVDLVNA